MPNAGSAKPYSTLARAVACVSYRRISRTKAVIASFQNLSDDSRLEATVSKASLSLLETLNPHRFLLVCTTVTNIKGR